MLMIRAPVRCKVEGERTLDTICKSTTTFTPCSRLRGHRLKTTHTLYVKALTTQTTVVPLHGLCPSYSLLWVAFSWVLCCSMEILPKLPRDPSRRWATFPLNSTAPMKIQPSLVNTKGLSLAPWWGQSCFHWSVPTPRSCQRPRLEDHNHESKSERRDRGRRKMMKKQQDVRLGKRNGKKEISGITWYLRYLRYSTRKFPTRR
jgi:hypothetical protein